MVVLDRVETPRGELVLRQDGEHFEVISNGMFLMDTRNGESERVLIRTALASLASNVTSPPTFESDRAVSRGAMSHCWQVLVGGLGVGFSLAEALSDDRVARVTVVEIEPTIVEWHHRYLSHITGDALADPRCEIVVADLRAHLAETDDQYDAICLDIDNGPDWVVTVDNAGTYDDAGTALVASRLSAGGALTVWSAARSPAYEQVLRRHFGNVDVVEIPVPRGEADVVFAAREPVPQTLGRDSDSS